ncbi:hypothetical protein ACHWQZ_G004968 [Mnemiopsis leidyi]
MNCRRFFIGLSLIVLIHTAFIAYVFQDRIIELNLLSSDTISVSKDAALADDAHQHIIIQELEKMWQEQLVDNLFDGTASTSEVTEKANNFGLWKQLENTESYLHTTTQIGATVGEELKSKDFGKINENRIHTISAQQQKVQDKLHNQTESELEEGSRTGENSNNPDEVYQKIIDLNQKSTQENQKRQILKQTFPAKPKTVPAKPKTVPAKPKTVPAKPKTVPTKPKTVPTKPKTVPRKPKMVFVLTQSRHGSTWLMDVLGFPDEAVPVFEPLNMSKFLRMYAESEEAREEGLAKGFTPTKYQDWREVFLARICICDFDGTQIPGKNHYGSILGLWYKEKRLHPDHVGTVSEQSARATCKEEGAMMIPKTIRYYNMSTLYRVGDFGCDNFKVIHLVRDPRAVMNSRMSVFHELYDGSKLLGPHIDGREGQAGFDQAYMEKAANWMCSHHLYNYKLGINPPDWLEGRYKMVRYEDLAASPDYWTREILHFIGVQYTRKYKEYVYNITHIKERGLRDKGTYSVEKEASDMIDKWRDKLIEPHWRSIERVCAEMMKAFKYEPSLLDSDR